MDEINRSQLGICNWISLLWPTCRNSYVYIYQRQCVSSKKDSVYPQRKTVCIYKKDSVYIRKISAYSSIKATLATPARPGEPFISSQVSKINNQVSAGETFCTHYQTQFPQYLLCVYKPNIVCTLGAREMSVHTTHSSIKAPGVLIHRPKQRDQIPIHQSKGT